MTERAATLGSFGIWSVTFTERDLESKAEINFTRRFGDSWEGVVHAVTLGHARVEHGLTHEPGASPRRGEGGG